MWCNSNTLTLGDGKLASRLTQEEVQKRLDETFVNKVILVSEYINKRCQIKLRCTKCGHEWQTLAQSVICNKHLHQCPNCLKLGRITLKCAYCGKEFERCPSDVADNKSGYFYCSRNCGNLHKNLIRKESGEWDNSKSYRIKAYEAYEHKCAVCGWDEDERVLEVHHIDENRENNKIENLCILCPTCHKKLSLHLYTLTKDFKIIPIEV